MLEPKELSRIVDNKSSNTNGTSSRDEGPEETLSTCAIVMCALVCDLNVHPYLTTTKLCVTSMIQ